MIRIQVLPGFLPSAALRKVALKVVKNGILEKFFPREASRGQKASMKF